MWCFRGQQIPQELIDHLEFEYYHHRKLDFNNEKDFQLIREFWAANGTANGMPIRIAVWHK